MKRIFEIIQLYFNRIFRVDDFVIENQMNEIIFVLRDIEKIFIDIFDVVRFVYRLNFIESEKNTFEFDVFSEIDSSFVDEKKRKIDFS